MKHFQKIELTEESLENISGGVKSKKLKKKNKNTSNAADTEKQENNESTFVTDIKG